MEEWICSRHKPENEYADSTGQHHASRSKPPQHSLQHPHLWVGACIYSCWRYSWAPCLLSHTLLTVVRLYTEVITKFRPKLKMSKREDMKVWFLLLLVPGPYSLRTAMPPGTQHSRMRTCLITDDKNGKTEMLF